MTAYTRLLVGLVTAAARDAANAAAQAGDYGPDNFGVPYSADGTPPATHWGFACWSRPDQVALMRAALPSGVTLHDAPRWVDGVEQSLSAYRETVLAAAGLTGFPSDDDI